MQKSQDKEVGLLNETEMKIVDRFINDVEAAKLLSASPQTLRNKRSLGASGPPYYKQGRLVRYRISDLITWMEEGRIGPKVGE